MMMRNNTVPPPLSSSPPSSSSSVGCHHHHLRQWPPLSMIIFILAGLITTSTLAAMEPSHHSFASILTRDHHDGAASTHTSLNDGGSTDSEETTAKNRKYLPPPNFLRWRSLQQQDPSVYDDENKTNEDWNMTSNDYNNDTGVFVTFPSFGLQIGPMSNYFVSSSSLSTSRVSSSSSLPFTESSSKNDIANELSTAIHIQQSMLGLHYAIESYVNETFRRTLGTVVNDTNYTTGKFAFGDILKDIKFVSECQYVNDVRGEGGDDEPVRNLEQALHTNITVYIPGGRAFYVFGVAGWWMDSIPTSMELYNLIIDSMKGKEGDVMGGGGLASWVRNMAVNGPESMLVTSGNVDTNEGITAMDGDLTVFQSVEGVKIIEGLTLAPTASPDYNPDSSIEDETVISGQTNDDALIEDTEDNGDYNDTNDSVGSGATDTVENSVVLETNSSNGNGNDEANDSKIVIIAGALSCLLVLSAVIGLFIYKRRHRNVDRIGRIEGGRTKIVPMSMMSDENDGCCQGYSDVYNGLFHAAGGGMGGGDGAVEVDLEAGHREGNIRDRVAMNVESTSRGGRLINNPIVKITKGIGSSVVAATAVKRDKDGEQLSQQDDSLVPQVGGTAIVDTRLHSLGFEANTTTPPTDEDGPQQNYTEDGGAKKYIAMPIVMEEIVDRSSKRAVTIHEIEKASSSTRVKRVTFAENIVEKEVQAHDILDDINAAAALKRSLINHSSILPPSAAMNIIENEDENDHRSKETIQGVHKEVHKDEYDSCGILNIIGEAARRVRPSNENAYIPRNDPPGDEVFVTTKKDDPPGDDLFVSKDDDATIETDIFSGLRNIHDDDDVTSSTYETTPMGCGTNIIQQTKEFFLCKQARLRGQHQGSLTVMNKSSNGNYPSSTDDTNPKTYYSSDTPPIVSDDEYDSEIDESSSAMIHRPWKDRWNMDPYANQTSGQRLMCSTPESGGGSNYDPDSDWDVSDTEVDFAVVEEDIFATRNLRSNSNTKR